MGEYDRKQQKQESRAIAYNGGGRQLKKIVDNTPHTLAQAKMINSLQKSPDANVIQKFDVPKNYRTHVAGEIKIEKKREKEYKGGHSQPLMNTKWKEKLVVNGTQSNDAAYEAAWSLKSKPLLKEKTSTFYPNSWNYDEIEEQIKSTVLNPGRNSAQSKSGIIIAKSGDTAYPMVSK